MAKRGRIVRDPTAGAGLVMVHGRQHSFGLEGVWRSDALPRPGVVVDVEFDDAGRVVAMMAVPDARLAREQAEAAIALAATRGAGLVARLGLPQVAAFARHQLTVTKQTSRNQTSVLVRPAAGDERVVELARMLSGSPDSAKAQAHARELLASTSG